MAKPLKISAEDVAELRKKWISAPITGVTQAQLAKKYKISQAYVSMLVNNSFRVPPKIGTADRGSSDMAPDFVRPRGGLKLVVNR
jgi:hypothetical protein